MITLYKLFAVNTLANLKVEPKEYTSGVTKPLYLQIKELINDLNLGEEKSRCMIYDTDNTRRIYENGYIEIKRKYIE